MKHSTNWVGITTGKAMGAMALLTIAITFSSAGVAQENVLGPPDVLQYPFEASESAPRGVAIIVLRDLLERGGDLALCEALMRQAGRTVPANFDQADCEPDFADKVRNGEGVVHWASGARPLQCGESCVGRPFMTRTQFTDHPNLRQAMVYGHLTFVADPPGPINRNITYGFEARFTCDAENGAKTGNVRVDVKFGEPVIGDPGSIESILDFILLPARLSDYVERRIHNELSSAGGATEMLGPCRSIGVLRALDSKFDSAMFDPATTGRRSGLPELAAATTLGDRATIRFLRITRNPLPINVDPANAAPGNPAAGYFNVFLNGSLAAFPPISPNLTGGIDLPPAGGTVELNFCRTISLTDRDRLQILFTNGLGGAVWSQFRRVDKFGASGLKRMTTGRTIVVPGIAGPPNPLTGHPTPSKPHPVTVREFELSYTITFSPRPGAVVAPESAGPGRHPGDGGATRPSHPSVAVDHVGPALPPCREI